MKHNDEAQFETQLYLKVNIHTKCNLFGKISEKDIIIVINRDKFIQTGRRNNNGTNLKLFFQTIFGITNIITYACCNIHHLPLKYNKFD